MYKKILVFILASLLISISLFVLGCSASNSQNQNNQKNTSSENSSLIATTNKEAVFKGFVLTTYTVNSEVSHIDANNMEGADKQVLTPETKILLAEYTPAMSNVAGLPFIVDITGDDKDGHYIEVINVYVDSGKLNRWNRETGVVSSGGQSTTIDIGETIYWSPDFNEDNANIKNITIIIEAVINNTVIGRQKIYITQDEPGYYYATVGELEL